MTETEQAPRSTANFRQFFLRGLGVLLPTVLTIYILVIVFAFVENNIASPINRGVRHALVRFVEWPPVTPEEVEQETATLTDDQRIAWRTAGRSEQWIIRHVRMEKLNAMWNRISIGGFRLLNLIGLLLAITLIYIVGRVLGSYIGRGVHRRMETGMNRVPIFKQVYPYVKQVTDFIVGDERDKLAFNQVVAVEYPRKGMWSVGLMTGDTMQAIQDHAGTDCMTIFIPSSPTPFTGYVITVPRADTIPLRITIDEALRFVVSGGVIVPDGQVIRRPAMRQEGSLPSPSLQGSQQTDTINSDEPRSV